MTHFRMKVLKHIEILLRTPFFFFIRMAKEILQRIFFNLLNAAFAFTFNFLDKPSILWCQGSGLQRFVNAQS